MGLILFTAFCPRQVAMGAAQLGFLATFMSDPMISGFTTGSAVLVVISQVKHILGLKVPQIPAPLAAPKVNNVILCIHKKNPQYLTLASILRRNRNACFNLHQNAISSSF